MHRSARRTAVALAAVALLMLSFAVPLIAAGKTEPDGKGNSDAVAEQKAKLTAAFEKWVAGKPPQQQAWEHVLIDNLGSFYLPLYEKAKLAGHETAWDYVADNPRLPRVLLIGDSISRGYTVPTRHDLAGKVNLHRAPANCGNTKYGLQKLDTWLGEGHWDLIHFNFGIHDVNAHMDPKVYAANLEQIVARLEKTGAKLVWASSTPLTADDYHRNGIVEFNAVAAKIMKAHHIPIDDLYTAITPHVDEWQHKTDHCHYDAPGYTFLGKVVSADILHNLQVAPEAD